MSPHGNPPAIEWQAWILKVYDQKVFYTAIDTGHRPPLPKKWPSALRDLLANCWLHDPAGRPEFCEIVPLLEAIKHKVDVAEAKKKGEDPPPSPRTGSPAFAPAHAAKTSMVPAANVHDPLELGA